jgi:hypothetical protein
MVLTGAVESTVRFLIFRKICVRALSRSSETDSRARLSWQRYQGGRSGADASQQAWLAPYRSSSRCTHTRPLPALCSGSASEFTAIKGVDVAWRTGWISDRAAAFLALGRPVITEPTAAEKYLPSENGFRFVQRR